MTRPDPTRYFGSGQTNYPTRPDPFGALDRIDKDNQNAVTIILGMLKVLGMLRISRMLGMLNILNM